MRYARRMALLAAALVTLVSALALQAAAGPPNHANRFEATFAETTVSVRNRIPDLGIFQLINTGTGTVEGRLTRVHDLNRDSVTQVGQGHEDPLAETVVGGDEEEDPQRPLYAGTSSRQWIHWPLRARSAATQCRERSLDGSR